MKTKRLMHPGIVLAIVVVLICFTVFKRNAARYHRAARITTVNAAPKVVFTLNTPTNVTPGGP